MNLLFYNELLNINGIGPSKAKNIMNEHKINNLNELKKKKNDILNDKQKLGLKYHPIRRIERKEIEEFVTQL